MRQPTATDLTLRKPTQDDSAFLLAVRNLPEVRAQSKNQDVIPEAIHQAWLKTQLESSASAIWIIEGGGQREGYIRAQATSDRTWLLSVALDQPFRGKGHGSWAVREACWMLKEAHGTCCLVAEVLSTNPSAQRLFETAGFKCVVALQPDAVTVNRYELIIPAGGG